MCEHYGELTRERFDKELVQATQPLAALRTPQQRNQVREFFVRAMTPGDWYYHMYRGLGDQEPGKYDVEAQISGQVEVFAHDENPLRVYHLKQIRRFLMRRYAFGCACGVNCRLRDEGESRLWLLKDYILPRVGLSLLIGWGAVLGAGDMASWLYYVARALFWPMVLLIHVTAWALVYLNVRDQIGKAHAIRRTLGASLGCEAWLLAGVGVTQQLSRVVPQDALQYHWPTALLIGSVALLLAILGQFFFAKAGSLADPL